MNTLGIDIGGRSIKLAALGDDDRWLFVARSDTYDRPATSTLAETLRRALPAHLPFDALALCLPGLYDPTRGCVTQSVNVPGLVQVPLTDFLHDALGFAPPSPPRICSDAVATAYDIYHSRNLAGRLLVIAIGTGVGAAVLDNGTPLKVDGDSPGHFGQIDVTLPDHEAVVGPDGGAGGLEGYLGAPALARDYGPDLPAAVARLAADDPPLLALARAIRIAHAIYRPHHVVLAGGIGIRLAPLLPQIRARVEDRLTAIARPGWTLAAGDDDFHAARGAARLAATDPG